MQVHEPGDYAAAIHRLVDDPGYHERLSTGALRHARGFGWDDTVDRLLEVYAAL